MAGQSPPPKPWERNRPASAALSSPGLPFSATQQADKKPWEQSANQTSYPELEGRTQAARPWESNNVATSSYSTSPGYGSTLSTYGRQMPYSSPYSSSTYNSPYGTSLGSSYPGYGAYGSSLGNRGSAYGGMGGMGGMYGAGGYGGSYSPYGGSPYGGSMYGSSMYNGSMYGGSLGGGPYSNSPYNTGMLPGQQPPFDPSHPPAPPSTWQHFLGLISGVMHFFGRLSFLVDENTHAVHFFISALLQLLDRAGSLYGEVARFILRLLGRRTKHIAANSSGSQLTGPGANNSIPVPALQTAGPANAALSLPAAGQWDNLWTN